MISSALILVPASGPCNPLTLLGGLSLLTRALLTAQRAGAQTCYVFTERDTDELKNSLQEEARLTATLVWLTRDNVSSCLPASAAGSCLLFSFSTLFHPRLARDLAQNAAGGEGWSVKGVDHDDALLLFPLDQLPAVLAALVQGGIGVAEGARLQTEWKVYPASGRFLYQLVDPACLHTAEKALLLSLENPKDGLVDAYLNRKLSRPLTRLLVRTPLTPNQITVLSCMIGLLGAGCFLNAGFLGPVIGAVLLQVSAVVDCVDGEVARVKFMESPLGEWLDITLDTVVHMAIFLGVGFAVWAQGETQAALFLGGSLVVGTMVSFPLVTVAEKTEELGEQRGGWEDQMIHKMVSGLASRDYSLLILVSAIISKLSWFLWGAAIGVHVFWLMLAVLLFKADRLRKVRTLLALPKG